MTDRPPCTPFKISLAARARSTTKAKIALDRHEIGELELVLARVGSLGGGIFRE